MLLAPILNQPMLDLKGFDERGIDYVGDIVEFDGLSDALNGEFELHLAAVSRVINDKGKVDRE